MDPFSALALAGLVGGGAAGIGQGIAGALGNNGEQKLVNQQLDRLTRKKQQGNLGLSGEQQQMMDQALNAPVQNAAAQARSRAEQIAAASGSSSGADLSRLRQEQGRTVATGAQNAAAQIQSADVQKRQQQLDEINRLTALKSGLKQDDYSSIFGGLSQVAGAAGGAAGVPKGGLGQAPTLETATGNLSSMMQSRMSPDELSLVQQYARDNPQEFYSMLFGSSTGGP